jgi:outer membrane protein OmpA-like peptidoglycan-associated protein
MDIISNQMSQTYLGATIGVGFVLWNRFEIYTNADIKQAENYTQTFIQGGVKIGFGERVKPDPVSIIRPETPKAPIIQEQAAPLFINENEPAPAQEQPISINEEQIAPLSPDEIEEIYIEIDIDELLSQIANETQNNQKQNSEPKVNLPSELEVDIDMDIEEQLMPISPPPAVVSEAEVKVAQERRKAAIQSFKLLAATFETGSAALSPSAKMDISLMADKIKKMDYKKITVEGHTDSTGETNVNLNLSKRRAKTIYDEFIEAGIPREKIEYIGFGSAIPIDSNATEAGKSKNRRVEIFVE